MALALMRAGLAVERWSVQRREVTEDFEALASRLRAELERDPDPEEHAEPVRSRYAAAELIESAPEPERPALLAQWRSRHREHPTLRAWLDFDGAWLLAVDGDADAHWIAARAGIVIAGDDAAASAYANWPIIEALRVIDIQGTTLPESAGVGFSSRPAGDPPSRGEP